MKVLLAMSFLQAPGLPAWTAVLAGLEAAAGPLLLAVAGLVILTVADVLSGIASAAARGVFSWDAVHNFYARTVLPKVLGWLVLTLLTLAASLALLPAEAAGWVGGGLAALAYLALLNDFRRSIFDNLREVFGGGFLPAPPG